MPIPPQEQQKPQPRFLFVDDDEQILTLFERFFSKQAEVSLARDGREALQQISHGSFDCIISDVNMPILNGFDLFKCLYAQDPSISQHFLFCSGHPSREFEAFCAVYDIKYLRKPISLLDLQEELKQFCKENGSRALL